jgi:hypothetical protein
VLRQRSAARRLMTIVSSPCIGITRRPVRACTARAGLPFRSRSRHSNASHKGSGAGVRVDNSRDHSRAVIDEHEACLASGGSPPMGQRLSLAGGYARQLSGTQATAHEDGKACSIAAIASSRMAVGVRIRASSTCANRLAQHGGGNVTDMLARGICGLCCRLTGHGRAPRRLALARSPV